MLWRGFCGLVALFVFCNGQVLGKKITWDVNDPENPYNSWINIDSERNNDVDGPWPEYTEELSGSGSGIDDTDDEDLLQGSGSGSGAGVPDFTNVDKPPRVDAGPDVSIWWPQNSVLLCGNRTTDDYGIRRYQWTQNTQLFADMIKQGAKDVCVMVRNMEVGDYTFVLQVFDTAGNIGSDTINVYVRNAPGGATTKAPALSPCEQLRDASKHLLGNYVPRCTASGEYDSLQCKGHESTGSCWCSDLDGAEIPGTNVQPPPDCERGNNLPQCIFKLVQHMRNRLFGAFRPKCTINGDFEFIQCEGSMCFCVDRKTGVKQVGTETALPDTPKCGDAKSIMPTQQTARPVMTPRPVPRTDAPIVDLNLDDKETPAPQPGQTTEVTNDTGPRREPSSASHMISQPGILAAIIGGSVVLLLCAILLVMFIVYRMRKKDEGSYALDEPKKMPNYSYQRAPDKEFYA